MSNPRRAVSRRSLVAVAAGGVAAVAGAVVAVRNLSAGDSSAGAPLPPPGPLQVAADVADLHRRLSAARDGEVVTLTSGSLYVLDRALQVRGTGVVLDGAGATLRLADGAERRSDRVLDVVGTRCRVHDLKIARRSSAPNATDHSWTVQLRGNGNTIEQCSVDVASGYAIGVAAGSGHTIADNTVTGGGILYGWDDVSGTRCVRNRVSKTSGNAFSGIGNNDAKRPMQGCIVSDNVIQDCGRIGIEDWGNVLGTRIERNTITRSRYMGISAVGASTLVSRNIIENGGRDYGIETGASGNDVRDNVVRWTQPGTATGLIVNDRWKFGDGKALTGFRSGGNTITNALVGISLNGALGAVVIGADTIADSTERAISIEPRSAQSVQVTGTTISFSGPSIRRTAIRDGISVANVTAVVIERCTITFRSASAGPAKDYFVRVESTGVQVLDCTFDASGRRDANRPVVGSVSGSIESRITSRGNRFSGL